MLKLQISHIDAEVMCSCKLAILVTSSLMKRACEPLTWLIKFPCFRTHVIFYYNNVSVAPKTQLLRTDLCCQRYMKMDRSPKIS
jgi:hypothetical protein